MDILNEKSFQKTSDSFLQLLLCQDSTPAIRSTLTLPIYIYVDASEGRRDSVCPEPFTTCSPCSAWAREAGSRVCSLCHPPCHRPFTTRKPGMNWQCHYIQRRAGGRVAGDNRQETGQEKYPGWLAGYRGALRSPKTKWPLFPTTQEPVRASTPSQKSDQRCLCSEVFLAPKQIFGCNTQSL